METMTSAMYDSRRKTVERAQDLKESAEFHRQIYRAIRAKKPELAREAMERHLRLAQTAQDSESELVNGPKEGEKARTHVRRSRRPQLV
jgi:GntR family transcriptional regulator, transcriptional repressor for pyruvate dehydrogenase complex